MIRAVTTTITEVELDIDSAAGWFAGIADDDMARFFCAVAKRMDSWPAANRGNMLYYVGKHLATCECSTEAGRQFIREIAEHMEHCLGVAA